MNRIYTLFSIAVILILHHSIFAQHLHLDWAISTGAPSSITRVYDIFVDGNQNTYELGTFSGETDFAPGLGVSISQSEMNEDVFLRKLDSNGHLVWVKEIKGRSIRFVAMTVDGNGNFYITGRFTGLVDCDPSAAVYNISSHNNDQGIFILKLDNNGNFIWAKSIISRYLSQINDIGIDNLGNTYIAGRFRRTVDFNPNGSGASLSSAVWKKDDLFILSLDANGNFRWVKQIETMDDASIYRIQVHPTNGLYLTGKFDETIDFNPSTNTTNLSPVGDNDIFILKLDLLGTFIWAKSFGGIAEDFLNGFELDNQGNIIITGSFKHTVDFDPSSNVFNLSTSYYSNYAPFLLKLDSNGNFIWAKKIWNDSGLSSSGHIMALHIDANNQIYVGGSFINAINLSTTSGIVNYTNTEIEGIFIKMDSNANIIWNEIFNLPRSTYVSSIYLDALESIYLSGSFRGEFDISPNKSHTLSTFLYTEAFLLKYQKKNVKGKVYLDYNHDCHLDAIDKNIDGQNLIIQPGNINVTTNVNGTWSIDSLPVGNYTVTLDTVGTSWVINCPISKNFSITNSDSLVFVDSIGVTSLIPCSDPNVSVFVPSLNTGAIERVYIQACNSIYARDSIHNAYVVVELPTSLTPQTASLSYNSMGFNRYRINIGTLPPDSCINIWMDCLLSSNLTSTQTLCIKTTLNPLDSCALDTLEDPYPDYSGAIYHPCSSAYDNSTIAVSGTCINNTVRFTVQNNGPVGSGDMTCEAPVRVYSDCNLAFIGSVQLNGGASQTFDFAADGTTWRIEVDQHPLHPGNSKPNATVELCNTNFISNWTPGMVTRLPMDDADPHIDIYCGIVDEMPSYNSKVGYPLGSNGAYTITYPQYSNNIPSKSSLDYVIRFQNTTLDTVHTVVIRDTLDDELDVYSFQSGASSHPYTVKIYGQGIIEWTFDNIQLPSNSANPAASHGFISFTVKPFRDLSFGTINNTATIDFDGDTTLYTNTTTHTIANYAVFTEIKQIEPQSSQPLEVSIFPNPTTGLVQIETQKEEELNIKITDNLGQEIYQEETYGSNIQLNLEHYVSGIYHVIITNGKSIKSYKLIKQ